MGQNVAESRHTFQKLVDIHSRYAYCCEVRLSLPRQESPSRPHFFCKNLVPLVSFTFNLVQIKGQREKSSTLTVVCTSSCWTGHYSLSLLLMTNLQCELLTTWPKMSMEQWARPRRAAKFIKSLLTLISQEEIYSNDVFLVIINNTGPGVMAGKTVHEIR